MAPKKPTIDMEVSAKSQSLRTVNFKTPETGRTFLEGLQSKTVLARSHERVTTSALPRKTKDTSVLSDSNEGNHSSLINFLVCSMDKESGDVARTTEEAVPSDEEKDNTGENAEVPEGNVQSEDKISTRTWILSNVSRIWIKNVLFAFEPTEISSQQTQIKDYDSENSENSEDLNPVKKKTIQDKTMIRDALRQYAREHSRRIKSCAHYCADLNLEIPFQQQSWS